MTYRRLLAAVAAVALTGTLGSCTTEGESGTSPAPEPTEEPNGDASPTPTPTPDEPNAIAAVTAGGDVVLMDPESGEQIDQVLGGISTDDPAKNGIAISPDGQTIFVVRPAQELSENEIVRVDRESGESEVLANGGAPAVSPDGQTLAYTVVENGLQPTPAIVVHDLESGDERVLRSEGADTFVFISELTWWADGSELAFMAGEIQTGIHVVDADAASLDAARRVGPVDLDHSWRSSAVVEDDRLAVVAVAGDPVQRELWTVQVVDRDGTVVEEPLPVERIEAAGVASRPGESGLAVIDGTGPDGGTLMLWDGGDQLTALMEGVVAVAW